ELLIVAIRGCADDSRNLDRDYDAVVVHCPDRRIRLRVRAGHVMRGMRKVIALVTFRGNYDGPLLHREPDGPLLRLPDSPLHRIVLAVEEIGISEVAVVGHVDVVRAGPDEGADD